MDTACSMRVGIVSSVDENDCTVRVRFPDLSGIVSAPLQMVMPFTQRNHAYFLPDVNDQVVCIFLGNGIEHGFCIGAVYSKKNPPVCRNKDRYYIEFDGGAHVLVDRAQKVIQVKGFNGEFMKFNNGDMMVDLPGTVTWFSGVQPTPLRD